MSDFYEVLGVSRNATDDDIKKAYRQLARQHHPDANPDDPNAAERFKEVSRAYETLRDPERRRRYDMFGTDDERAAAGAGFGGANAFGLNDLFDAFFGGDVFGRTTGRANARGHDIEVTLQLTLAEAVFGTRTTVEQPMPVECDTCDGRGAAPGSQPTLCTTCNGAGQVRQVRRSMLGQMVTAGPCPACQGTGDVIATPCPSCQGEGRVHGSRSLEVDVPAGIDDGQRLRLAGRGPAGPRGAEAGDFYVQIRVAPDENLERRGDDLWRRLPVSMVQAALGTNISIETLDGSQDVEIAPGTAPGLLIRLKGLGAPNLRNGRRGDLICEVEVQIPLNLTAEEAEVLAQFAALRGEEVSPREGLFSRIKSAFQ